MHRRKFLTMLGVGAAVVSTGHIKVKNTTPIDMTSTYKSKYQEILLQHQIDLERAILYGTYIYTHRTTQGIVNFISHPITSTYKQETRCIRKTQRQKVAAS